MPFQNDMVEEKTRETSRDDSNLSEIPHRRMPKAYFQFGIFHVLRIYTFMSEPLYSFFRVFEIQQLTIKKCTTHDIRRRHPTIRIFRIHTKRVPTCHVQFIIINKFNQLNVIGELDNLKV